MRYGRGLTSLVVVAGLLNTAACGYLIYPERVGHRGQQVDGTVVALDAVGLLFFILPGVIAFAVDLSTGCIYMPEGRDGGFSLQGAAPAGWSEIARVAPYADDETIARALDGYVAQARVAPLPPGGRFEWQTSGMAAGFPRTAIALNN